MYRGQDLEEYYKFSILSEKWSQNGEYSPIRQVTCDFLLQVRHHFFITPNILALASDGAKPLRKYVMIYN
jgi:hypothetical protein